MKKVLLVLFLFLCINEVNAKTYYSEYGEFSSYTEKEVLENDLTKVEVIDKYQLYEEVETYEYLEDYEGIETGNIKDIETNWVDNYNLLDFTKNVEECYRYESININEFNYILIDNESDFNIVLKKIKFVTKSGEIIFERENIKLFDFSTLNIGLIDYGYKFNEIKMEVIYEKENPHQEGELSVGYYLNINDDHLNKEYRFKNISTNSNILEDEIDDFSVYTKYSDKCYNELPSSGKNYKTYYRNKYTLKEYKVITKKYLDEYSEEPKDGYKIDKEKIKKYYRYKIRDKVEIKDELIIDSYDVKLTDFILNSTISIENIKIISDVDYSKNGEYTAKFILPFKTIEKNVSVAVETNFINTINKQADYINELKNKNEISSYAVDKKNLEIKELIIEEENKVNETLKELDSCYKSVSALKTQKQKFKVETKEKDYKKFYILILLVLIAFLIIIRKNIHKKIS